MMLRAENDNLKNENYRLQAALRNLICPNCGGAAIIGDIAIDEHQLRLENARLREEVCNYIWEIRPVFVLIPKFVLTEFCTCCQSFQVEMDINQAYFSFFLFLSEGKTNTDIH